MNLRTLNLYYLQDKVLANRSKEKCYIDMVSDLYTWINLSNLLELQGE